jgi:hypothetical protein
MAYFYHQQFKKHIAQFAEIFRGLEVQTGVSRDGTTKMIEVPIVYGSMDRVAASIAAGNTQNTAMRLPTMAVHLSGIALMPERFKGIDTEKVMPYTPKGGVFPNDTKSIVQRMPVPFQLSLDLHIYSNNIDTQLQILEQILVLFNPSVQIQISDSAYDGSKITKVDLVGISNDDGYPSSTERRMLINTLSFETIVYLTAPSKLRNDRIQDIIIRITQLNDQSVDNFIPDYDYTIMDVKVEETLTPLV